MKNHPFLGAKTPTPPPTPRVALRCVTRCVVYIFAIALTQLSEDTKLGQTYFPTLADGMRLEMATEDFLRDFEIKTMRFSLGIHRISKEDGAPKRDVNLG